MDVFRVFSIVHMVPNRVTRHIIMSKEIFIFANHAENEVGRLVPDIFFFLKKLYVM